jgi:ribosomal protein S18 acetylase RimI-like enzyme
MSELKIRALRVDDLPAVASVHLMAFSGRALSELGHEVVRRYYDWQLRGPHESVCLGVFQAEDLTGFCFGGVFHGALTGFLRKNRSFLVWRVLSHPWLISSSFFRERMALAINVLRRTSAASVHPVVSNMRSFGILAVAVNPDHQGLGLGKKLMQASEKVALERSFSRMHLTVEPENIQAVTFYESLGWQKAESSDVAWHGSMFKNLTV